MSQPVCDENDAAASPGRLRRRLAGAGLGLALLANSGCVTTGPGEWIHNGFKLGPNYSPPPAAVAEEWIEAADPRIQSRHEQFADWWTVFQDPTLNSLIDTAYEQNPTLRIAGARVLQARAQRAIAVGSLFPQSQQAFGDASRIALSRNSPNFFSFLEESYFSDWTAGFNLSWELDFWGRFRRNIESANANVDLSEDGFDDALVTLLADVATSYVQFRVAQQRIKIARDNVTIQEGILALAEERFRVGTATKLDVEQAKTVLEQTRSTIPALQILRGQANDTLCILLGGPPRDLEPELGAGPELGVNPIPNSPHEIAAGVPAELLRRRPDVRAAERRVAAQSAQIGVAEADLYPAIFVNGTIGYEATSLSNLFASSSFMGDITPNFRWNIFNYGRIQNNVRLQVARTDELIAAYQNQVLIAGQESQSSLRSFLRSQEQATDLARSVTAAGAATQIGVQQYKTGVVPFNTVFNLETIQVQQQDNLAVVQGNIALSLINAYRALGGGWELRYQKEGLNNAAACSLSDQAPSPPLPAEQPSASVPSAESP